MNLLRNLPMAAAVLPIFTITALPARAQPADQPSHQRTLILRGEGSASAVPDLVWLRAGVDTEAAKARKALKANADTMKKVVAALKSDGLADKDIQTSNLFIAPLYSSDPKKPRRVVGYRVGNMVLVRIRDLEQTGVILDQIVALGSNDIAGVRFAVNDPTALENKARAAAVRNAITKAKLYAGAAGVKLGPIVKIAEIPTKNPGPAFRRYTMAPGAAAPIPLEAGELTFHAIVAVTWNIE